MDAFLETLKNMGPARLAMMLITLFGLFIFFIFIAVRSGTPSMTLLYGELSTGDSTEIAAKLDISGIPFTLSADGKQVMVPYKEVGRSRMLLAEEGLPSDGSMGYELFDKKQSFGTTSFIQNINQLRALEGELSRTISTLDVIKRARVHLVLPQRELFSRESRAATASIFLSTRGGVQISSEQILAIQHLTASSVPQLKPAHVSIIDDAGNLLARGDDENNNNISSPKTSEAMTQKYEQRLTRKIEDMLSRIVGHGKIRASVSADLDFNVTSRNSEIYDPEGQVVRSTQNTSEEDIDNSNASDRTVTVQNNLPGLPGGNGESDVLGSKSNRSEEIVNYEITKTIETFVQESGEVQRLSVAILVDGHYEDIPVAATDDAANKDADDAANKDAKPEQRYIPRTQAELDQIALLVKSSIGYDESRGDTLEVVNMKFAKVAFFDNKDSSDLLFGFPKSDIVQMVETLTLSIVAILIILLVLRPLVSHIAISAKGSGASGASAEDELALLTAATSGAAGQLPSPDGTSSEGSSGGDDISELEQMLDVNQVEGKVKASSVQKISELVDNHPNETVSVIRSWMSSQEG